MQAPKSLDAWAFRLILLIVLFVFLFILGSIAVGEVIPDDAPSQPGLVSPAAGLLIIALANLLVIVPLILTSRWGGWKLAILLALAYYGAVTVLPQVETWYYLSSITVSPQLLASLFLMGVPTAADQK